VIVPDDVIGELATVKNARLLLNPTLETLPPETPHVGQEMAPSTLTTIGETPVKGPPLVVVAHPGHAMSPAALTVTGLLPLKAPPFVVVAHPGQDI
jgi:hypothetical protein